MSVDWIKGTRSHLNSIGKTYRHTMMSFQVVWKKIARQNTAKWITMCIWTSWQYMEVNNEYWIEYYACVMYWSIKTLSLYKTVLFTIQVVCISQCKDVQLDCRHSIVVLYSNISSRSNTSRVIWRLLGITGGEEPLVLAWIYKQCIRVEPTTHCKPA